MFMVSINLFHGRRLFSSCFPQFVSSENHFGVLDLLRLILCLVLDLKFQMIQ